MADKEPLITGDGDGLFDKFLVIPRSRIVKQSTDPSTGLVRVTFEPEVLDVSERYFVLNPRGDQAALLAMSEYARHCYPRLNSDIRSRVASIRRRGQMKLSRTGQLNLSWIDSRQRE